MAVVIFVKICVVKAVHYLVPSRKFCPNYLYFSSYLEKVSKGKAIKLYLLILRLVKVVLYLTDVYAFLSVVSYEICT